MKAGVTPTPKPTDPPPTPPTKTVSDELAEVEGTLTDELKKLANDYLEKMGDEDATRVAGDEKTRLAFLKGLRDDPAHKTISRPKTFWDKPKAPTPPGEEDVYAGIMKQIGVQPNGPASPSGRRGAVPKGPQKPRAKWLRGS